MTEQKETPASEKDPKSSSQSDSQDVQGEVTLTAEQYNTLLDKLDDLEDEVQKKGGGSVVDQLADEVKAGTQDDGSKETVDLDELSQSELAHHIVSDLTQGVVQPLLVEIQGMKLQREIDAMEGDEKYAPVWAEHKDRVVELATENPKLTMKQATDLAAKEKEGTKESDSKDSKKSSEVLRHLPERGSLGEKPGGSPALTQDEEPEDRKSAAALAVEKLDIKFDH